MDGTNFNVVSRVGARICNTTFLRLLFACSIVVTLAWILIFALAKVFTKVEVVLLIRVGNVISIWSQPLFFSGDLQWSVIIEGVINFENTWICTCGNDKFLRV